MVDRVRSLHVSRFGGNGHLGQKRDRQGEKVISGQLALLETLDARYIAVAAAWPGGFNRHTLHLAKLTQMLELAMTAKRRQWGS